MCYLASSVRIVNGATRGTLAGLALPNCKSYHQWYSTRLKGKDLGEGKGKKKRNVNCLGINPALCLNNLMKHLPDLMLSSSAC